MEGEVFNPNVLEQMAERLIEVQTLINPTPSVYFIAAMVEVPRTVY